MNIDILGSSELKWMRVDKFNSVQALSHIQLFTTPWSAACQASLSITNSWSLLKLIESQIDSEKLDAVWVTQFCHPLAVWS